MGLSKRNNDEYRDAIPKNLRASEALLLVWINICYKVYFILSNVWLGAVDAFSKLKHYLSKSDLTRCLESEAPLFPCVQA